MSNAIIETADARGPSPVPISGVRDYIRLLKPRVMSLVVFTGAVGLLITPGTIHPFLGVIAILCIAVASGAAASINMWYDRDIDAVMARTKSRPIPSGAVPAEEALTLGIWLSILSVTVMGLAVNWAAAAILTLSIGFYVFIYTMWLKRGTPQNIVIGGAAGAFPPMIGWAAVTGGVEVTSLALFAIIFFWTPPHFWALALFRCKDYAKAGVPMMPVVAGEKSTKRQMLLYTVLLMPLSLAPVMMGSLGAVYGVVAGGLGLWFLGHAIHVMVSKSEKAAPRMFAVSILYLFILFAAMLADHWILGAVR